MVDGPPIARQRPQARPRPAALLLTGGHSRRMGQDKAALLVAGEPLAQRCARLLHSVADPVIEVGPGYTALPRTCEDPPGGGPLSALAAGAAALRGDGVTQPTLVIATDLPHLTAAWLQLLADHPSPGPDYSVVPRDASGRPQPLCARYSPAALAEAQRLVASGHRSMNALLDRVAVTWLDGDGERDRHDNALLDVDTPEDLAALQQATRRP